VDCSRLECLEAEKDITKVVDVRECESASSSSSSRRRLLLNNADDDWVKQGEIPSSDTAVQPSLILIRTSTPSLPSQTNSTMTRGERREKRCADCRNRIRINLRIQRTTSQKCLFIVQQQKNEKKLKTRENQN